MDLKEFTSSGKKVDLNDYKHRCEECYQEYGTHHEKCLELSKYKLESLLVLISSRDSEWLVHKLESTWKILKGKHYPNYKTIK